MGCALITRIRQHRRHGMAGAEEFRRPCCADENRLMEIVSRDVGALGVVVAGCRADTYRRRSVRGISRAARNLSLAASRLARREGDGEPGGVAAGSGR